MSKQKASTEHIIARQQRLSQSVIWEIQRAYFLQNGMAAWQKDEVPHDISSNPFMADAYSQLVLSYLKDCHAANQSATTGTFPLNYDQPIYIIELGAGSGRLAHHFLHHFHPRFMDSAVSHLPYKLIMTDFVPEIIEFWQNHEKFQPWVEAGLLDFALFDVQDLRPLTLTISQQTFTPDQIQNPLILLANYFFDSIPQDSFVIEDGQLHENLLTLTSNQPEPDLTDPAIWQRLRLAYETRPAPLPYYTAASDNDILNGYTNDLPDTSLSFPSLGLDCLRFWQPFGQGRQLLLASDRGYILPDSLVRKDDPMPNLHGSFSLMVNFHAISEFVTRGGGLALYPDHYQDNLQVAAFLLGTIPQDGMETTQAFADTVVQFGPDDFFALREAVESFYNAMSLTQLLGFLRLSCGDTAVFLDLFPALQKEIAQADPIWYSDVYDTLMQIQAQHLPITNDDPVEEKIEMLLGIMGIEECDA